MLLLAHIQIETGLIDGTILGVKQKFVAIKFDNTAPGFAR
jgi:hypothetical protein